MARIEHVEGPLKVLLTGGTGFLGSAVRPRLAVSHTVEVYSRATGGDVLDLAGLCRAASGKHAVVHLAGLAEGSRHAIFTTNVQGTLNAAEAAARAGASLVFASSAGAYEPVTDYGLSKLLAEQVVERYALRGGLNASILRIFNVYGPGAHRSLVTRILEDDPVVLDGEPDTTRDLVHVDDVAAAVTACLRPVGLFWSDVGTGHGTRLADLARLAGRSAVYRPQPKASHIHTSVARHVQIPGWQPQVRLEDWLRAQAPQPAGRPA